MRLNISPMLIYAPPRKVWGILPEVWASRQRARPQPDTRRQEPSSRPRRSRPLAEEPAHPQRAHHEQAGPNAIVLPPGPAEIFRGRRLGVKSRESELFALGI